MRQRVVIAIAMANDPDVIIADEPTTALDVTVQAQVLEVLRDGAARRPAPRMVLITHDLGVVAGHADRVLVMYAGKPVETGTDRRALLPARGCRTRSGLLGSLPRLDQREPGAADADRGHAAVAGEPAAGLPVRAALPAGDRHLRLRASRPCCPRVGAGHEAGLPPLATELAHEGATDIFSTDPNAAARTGRARSGRRAAPAETEPRSRARRDGRRCTPRDRAPAVLSVTRPGQALPDPLQRACSARRSARSTRSADVSFDICAGETLGLVGESGCGKTTTCRAVLQPAAGHQRRRWCSTART